MVAGFECPAESGRPAGIALDFPASDSPSKVPRRIRQRLLERSPSSSSSSTLEEIEAKLKEADLRRQQFHEWLSSKARTKPRSPSWSSQKEVVGQQLEAKLSAAEKKRCSSRFLRSRKTTFSLAKAFESLEISEKSVKTMPFEQLAVRIESAATLQTVKSLMDRLESRITLSQANTSSLDNIDHLLKRLASPSKRGRSSNVTRSRGAKKGSLPNKETRSLETIKLLRYPARAVLCAYMILGHPDAVFSGQGGRETALAAAAANFVHEFELLLKSMLYGPSQSSRASSSRQSSPDIMCNDLVDQESGQLPCRQTFRSQLVAFDAVWCSYLYQFVVWKTKDARSLEDDLVRVACQLELSMMQTCKLTSEGDTNDLMHDMRVIQKQVFEDQRLLREKVLHLSGNAGIERMECALSDVRSKYFESKENENPCVSTPSSSDEPLVSVSEQRSPIEGSASSNRVVQDGNLNRVVQDGTSNRVVQSLFKDASSPFKVGFITHGNIDGHLGISTREKLITENELLANEIVHGGHRTFAESLGTEDEDQNGIKAKIKETIEEAFWDGVAESIKQGEPDYGRIIQLVKEVRGELYEMAPQSWKEEIHDSIDLDILSQVLKSGSHDIDYLGRILEFALATLRKLSAPANEDDMKRTHKNLLNELSEIAQANDKLNSTFVIATVKGLRFVLEQIQTLKREISKARMQLMEPFIKGPAGFQYLQKAFTDRCGHPYDALRSLPLTLQWLTSVRDNSEEEWEEHMDSLSTLTRHTGSSRGLPPVTPLRTGGTVPMGGNRVLPIPHFVISGTVFEAGDQQLECQGERVDLLVRLGLLKLASGIVGITQENLPETLKLNFSRMRVVQSQLQKIIVIATSILVLRQILASENSATSPTEVERIVTDSVERISELLDHAEDAGIAEIVEEAVGLLPAGSGNNVINKEEIQMRKGVMASMLSKSLRDADPVFSRVAQAVYLAVRGIVLCGISAHGKKLAEMALRRVGAAILSDRVVEAAGVLVVVATVSGRVHGPWYACLVENM